MLSPGDTDCGFGVITSRIFMGCSFAVALARHRATRDGQPVGEPGATSSRDGPRTLRTVATPRPDRIIELDGCSSPRDRHCDRYRRACRLRASCRIASRRRVRDATRCCSATRSRDDGHSVTVDEIMRPAIDRIGARRIVVGRRRARAESAWPVSARPPLELAVPGNVAG